MKKVKFLAMMLAAGMFAACSDALEDSGMDNGEGGNTFIGDKGYVNISLNLPTTSGANTRAESFDDGLAAEYNVNSAIIALFYGANEGAAKCKVAFKLTDGDFQMSGSNTDNITSYYASGVRMIPAPDDGENVYALAILNPTSNFIVTTSTDATNEDAGDAVLTTELQLKPDTDFEGTLADLNTAATYGADIASTTDKNGNFLMTNAPIAKSASFTSSNQPSDADYVMTLAPITVYNEKTLAEGAASDNPIYVERAVAKTTLKVNADEAKLTVDSEVPAYNEATVTFTGWKLQNTNKNYYPVRKVTDASIPDWDDWKTYFNEGTAVTTNEINRFFGQTANPYRTYWGIDPNYDQVLSGADLGTNFNILNQGGSASIDWNTVGVNSTVDYSGKFVEYCAENTTKAQAMQDDQLTGVLLKATFTPKGATTGTNFFMRNNTSAIYVETDFIAWATAILANGETGIPLNDGETLSLKRSSAGTITTPAGTITTSAQVQALLQVNVTNPSTSTKELTEAQANEILTEAGGNIKFYQDGVTYYYTTIIEHFDAVQQTPVASTTTISSVTDYVEAKHLGRYGMVRNNWYELQINSVSGPGEPEIPEIPSEPVDETNSYINCEINVLSWAKRQQGVDL